MKRQTSPAETERQIAEFSIGRDGVRYHYNGYRYDKWQDAVAYASLMRDRPWQADVGGSYVPGRIPAPATAAEQALITQMAQTAVCNRHHSLDKQLCRWLLLSLDRLRTSDLVMTQELIANMLGVRREGVTEAASNLQRAGLISYRRGHITVLDRQGLEQRTCECYEVVRKEYARLLPASTAR